VDENTLHTCDHVFPNELHPIHLSALSKCFSADRLDVVDALPSAEHFSHSTVFRGSLHQIFFPTCMPHSLIVGENVVDGFPVLSNKNQPLIL
jgi:hypothetical protein